MAVDVAEAPDRAIAAVAGLLGERVAVTVHPTGYPIYVAPADPAQFPDIAAFHGWLEDKEDALDRILADRGAIVFRGFPVTGTADFAALIDHYPTDEMGYSGGAATRSAIAGKVFEATRLPADMKLPVHQEMAYLPRWPAKLAFYCHVAADEGGATIVADIRRFEQLVPAELLTALRTRGIQYRRNFRAPGPFPEEFVGMHRTWQEAFYTTDPAKAEADCAAMGVKVHWEADGSLTTIHTAPAFLTHPLSGATHWFNHLQSMTVSSYSIGTRWDLYRKTYVDGLVPPYDIRFGDGSAIPLEDVEALYPLLDSVTVASPWRAGDVMMIDNIVMMHGRDPYKGSREVQVALLWGRAA